MTTIENGLFDGCCNLISITIPNSVTNIGENAFEGCVRLTNITVPDSVTTIGDWAFSDCYNLTSATIPNSVTNIGGWVFSDCYSLKSITIPESVTSIGYYAFGGCDDLIIYGKTGSVVEKYANDYDIMFIDVDNPVVKVRTVKLNYTSKTLNRGSRTVLKAAVSPSKATNKTVKWTTSNSKIATVTSTGVVTAKAKGTAYIRATAMDGSKKYAQCKITVKQPVTAVKLNATAKALNRGGKFTLKATVSPSNATNKTVKWTTTNRKVATVTQTGIVTAKAKGTAYIRATALDGSKKYAQCKVTVKQPVTKIKLNATSKVLKKGSRSTLRATVYPSTANVRIVSWKSTNTNVAIVTSKGVVTAKAKGTAYVRAIAKDGSKKYAQCKITVKK